jgi:hypothetical protein
MRPVQRITAWPSISKEELDEAVRAGKTLGQSRRKPTRRKSGDSGGDLRTQRFIETSRNNSPQNPSFGSDINSHSPTNAHTAGPIAHVPTLGHCQPQVRTTTSITDTDRWECVATPLSIRLLLRHLLVVSRLVDSPSHRPRGLPIMSTPSIPPNHAMTDNRMRK